MKSTTKETIYVVLLVIFAIVMIVVGVFYEYVKFAAYWKVAFGYFLPLYFTWLT